MSEENPNYEELLKQEQAAAEDAEALAKAEQVAVMKQLALEGAEIEADALEDFLAVIPGEDEESILQAVGAIKGFMAPVYVDPQVASGPRRSPKNVRVDFDAIGRQMYEKIKHKIRR